MAALLLGLSPFFVNATCGEKKDDQTESLITLLLLNNLANPAFVSSCNIPANGTCTNRYGSAGSCSGTVSTSKCTATGNLGACRTSSQSESVYYGAPACTSVSACQTYCTSIGGTFNSAYNGQ